MVVVDGLGFGFVWDVSDPPPQAASPNATDEHGAAALLAALAEWDVPLLRRAMLGETGDGNRGVRLLERAVEIAEDERG